MIRHMRPVRAVFFDLDGVLTVDASGSLTTTAALARWTALPRDVLDAAYRPWLRDLLFGRATHADIAPLMAAQLGHDLPMAAFEAAFASTPMDARMLALAERLSDAVVVGIITDNAADRVAHLVARHRLDATFSPIVISSEVGSGKHGPAIFRHALDRAGAAADEAVFIDNTPANLVASAALGMHVLHFDDAERDVEGLVQGLRGFGLLQSTGGR